MGARMMGGPGSLGRCGASRVLWVRFAVFGPTIYGTLRNGYLPASVVHVAVISLLYVRGQKTTSRSQAVKQSPTFSFTS